LQVHNSGVLPAYPVTCARLCVLVVPLAEEGRSPGRCVVSVRNVPPVGVRNRRGFGSPDRIDHPINPQAPPPPYPPGTPILCKGIPPYDRRNMGPPTLIIQWGR